MNFHLFPPEASTTAVRVDHEIIFLLVVCGLLVVTVFAGIIFYAIRYRNGARTDRTGRIHNSLPVEITWTIATAVLFIVFFFTGIGIYYDDFVPPANAIEIYSVGRQWMWKFEHPDGRREINELHLPVGESIRITMTSEDVIHDLFFPAFRVKRDVLPGRYTSMWFRPTRPGTYHLFCSQYCGAWHANMVGSVIVMNAADYQRWLSSVPTSMPMIRAGAELFRRYNCVACHQPGGRGPQLAGLPGSVVHLADGSTVIADDNYIRQSILASRTAIVAGYDPIMPVFQGQLSEEQLAALVAYIKSLGIEEQERKR